VKGINKWRTKWKEEGGRGREKKDKESIGWGGERNGRKEGRRRRRRKRKEK